MRVILHVEFGKRSGWESNMGGVRVTLKILERTKVLYPSIHADGRGPPGDRGPLLAIPGDLGNCRD